MRTIRELLRKATRLSAQLRAAAATEPQPKLPPIIMLPAPRAELVGSGKKSLIIDASSQLPVDTALRIADDEKIYGVVKLAKPRPMSIAEFRRRAGEHRLDDTVRKQAWPKHRKLYGYEVQEVVASLEPEAWTPPVTTGLPRQEPDDAALPALRERLPSVEYAAAAALEFERVAVPIFQQAMRLEPELGAPLAAAVAAAGPLRDSLVKLASRLDVEISAGTEVPLFKAAAILDDALHEVEALLPDSTRSGALVRLMLDRLPELRERETKMGQEADPEAGDGYDYGHRASLRGISPATLKRLSNEELLAIYERGKRLLETAFPEGKTRGAGMSLEDAQNAMAFIIAEARARGLGDKLGEVPKLDALYKAGPSDRYAPIHPGTEGTGTEEELALDDLLPHFHDEFLVRSPFIYLVGSIVNNGVSKNDVDILLRGPLDEGTAQAVEHRLGRMLPPEISSRAQFHCGDAETNVFSLGGPVGAHVPLYDLVVRRREDSQAVIEMRDSGLSPHPGPCYEIAKADGKAETTHPSVLQAHFRGRSVHGDFRINVGTPDLIGFTLAMQVPGSIPEFEGLAEAKKIAARFNADGSDWNKNLRAPAHVYASAKAPEPRAWLDIEAEAFKPGSVGATRNEPGYMVALARPVVTIGEMTSYFHEFFLEDDPKFSGLLALRMLAGRGGSEEETAAGRRTPEGQAFWTATLTKTLLPYVIKPRAVTTGRVPPQGIAQLPPGLKAAVPEAFRYWLPSDEKERREIRDALVKERFFTEENIKLVDGKFCRVVVKYHLMPGAAQDSVCSINIPCPPTILHDTPRSEDGQEKGEEIVKAETVEFALLWQRWGGEQGHAAPSHELYHLILRRGDQAEDFLLIGDPSGGSVSGLFMQTSWSEAEKAIQYEGKIDPGASVGALLANDSKATPSFVRRVAGGTVEVLESTESLRRLRFAGDVPQWLQGEAVLQREESNGDIWEWRKTAVQEKAERVGTLTLVDGTKLENVQVWDPADMRADDDKTDDRERLRPLAVYRPMKVAPRASNEFRYRDLDRVFTEFATPEMLKVGIVVQPKWNGFRCSIQRDADGRMLMLSEDIEERKTALANFLDGLPGVKEELESLDGPFILDGEFMALGEGGEPIPRRELAQYRTAGEHSDTNVRVQLFDVLYTKDGNVMGRPQAERRKLLEELLSGAELTRLELTPEKTVHTEEACREAMDWASKIPGSEGAMLKSLEATVTLRETDSMAKVKMSRELFGIVWEMHEVKGSPGVFNYFYAVGPVESKEGWKETVGVDGKIYVKAGKTFNTSVQVKAGGVLRIEVTELLWDESIPDAMQIRGFTPTVLEVVDREPTTLPELEAMLGPGERKTAKSDPDVEGRIAKSHASFEIVQKAEEERYVFGVVLVPDEFDSQGDIYDAEAVRRASYYFMEEVQADGVAPPLGLMHQKPLEKKSIRVLESYLAPIDMVLHGQFVKQGTWLLAAHVLDDALWQAIKDGKLTGWSMEGTALTQSLD